MKEIDETTPLALITVGQFLELIEQKTNHKEPEPKEEPKEDRVGINEISEMTGLSKSAIYKMTMDNTIPHRKFSKRLVFSRSEIETWMESQTTPKLNRDQKAAKQLADLATRKKSRDQGKQFS
jgi:excisionase family DNA binding protein